MTTKHNPENKDCPKNATSFSPAWTKLPCTCHRVETFGGAGVKRILDNLSQPQPQWEDEFREKFGMYSNYSDFCPDVQEYVAFIRSALLQVREETLREVGEIIEKHDPSTNRKTGKTYWGNTLRAEIKSLLENKPL